MSNKTYYEVLGVERTATRGEIVSAYREIARDNNPDSASDASDHARRSAVMLAANEAYDVLKNPVKRKAYDKALKSAETRSEKFVRGLGAFADFLSDSFLSVARVFKSEPEKAVEPEPEDAQKDEKKNDGVDLTL